MFIIETSPFWNIHYHLQSFLEYSALTQMLLGILFAVRFTDVMQSQHFCDTMYQKFLLPECFTVDLCCYLFRLC